MKFDGTQSQFRGFLNQVRLVIQMHPSRYPTGASRMGVVGTLLRGKTLAWFTLGYVIYWEGMSMDPTKIQIVLEW